MLKNRPFLFFFIILLVLSPTKIAIANNAYGNWQGSWVSFWGDSGSLYSTISQSGTSLSGSLSTYGTECGNFYSLPLTGTISGSIATFYATAYCYLDGLNYSLAFTQGALSNNTVAGYYSIEDQYGEYFDSGTFSMNRFLNYITATAGTGGNISPTGTISVSAGSNKTFAITPETGYEINDVEVDGSSAGAVGSYTFINIQANYTIEAIFRISVPLANFSASYTSGTLPLTVIFTDNSTGIINNWSWNFGDGTTSAVQNPSHTYRSAGSYTVELTVTGPGGSDTETKSEHIVVRGKSIPLLILLDD